jgi:glycosyltransferase involved in cell wall biosynthesis
VAFVIQRYGENITGGAETLCRLVAERLSADYEIEVLTTTATDHLSWANVLPAGVSRMNGVAVRRFPSKSERNLREFHKIYDRIFLTRLSAEEEQAMLRYQGPYCPGLIEYLKKAKDDYSAFVFFTYMYYPTCLGLPVVKDKAVFVPTAHDETALYMHLLDDLFKLTPHIVFNSEEERYLIQRRFNLSAGAGRVIGAGIDEAVPGEPDPAWDSLRRQIEGKKTLTFIGRVENGKGCDELVDYFLRYMQGSDSADAVLLLVGRRTLPIPAHPRVISTGYVSEYVKHQVLRSTDIVVACSPFESLGIAALEAMLNERPLLVNGRCPVLVGHCVRSNGGLWYHDYDEFAAALSTLLGDADLRRAMGAGGRAYVRQHFRWEAIIQSYREMLDQIIKQRTLAGAAS